MKAGKFTTAILIVATVFASCTKEKSLEQNPSPANDGQLRTTTVSGKGTYISDWESGYNWNLTDSADYKVYWHDKAISEVNSDVMNSGAVIVFMRNYLDVNGNRVDRIQKLPYHVLPDIGRPGYDNQWYYMVSDNKVTVKFRTNKTEGYVPLPDGSVMFRYFVLTASDLSGAGYNQSTVQTATYSDLVTKFGAGF